MAADRPIGSRKSWEADAAAQASLGNTLTKVGVFLGIIKNNIDNARRGRLQVFIPDFGGLEEESSYWIPVIYAGPFAGSTSQLTSLPTNSFLQSPHTYGMWFSSPDINNWVLVTFAGGDITKGYWFACIPNTVSHYMVPALGSISKKYIQTGTNDGIIGDQYPVTEHNDGVAGNNSYEKLPFNLKPVHSIQWGILVNQGLETDTVRGTITSSSHRESPSRVFGLSTPGQPIKEKTGVTPTEKLITARKGGHTFVLDDGDTFGKDQLVRLRTAGGHQIIMNDSEEILYVANSAGTAWLEFDTSGKIHLYGKDSINVRSENEINLHADANINLHSNKSINMYAKDAIRFESKLIQTLATTKIWSYGQTVEMGSGSNYNISASTTLNLLGSAAIVESGGTISLNCSTVAPPVLNPATLKQNSLADTILNGKIWQNTATMNTIVTILPSHEPSAVHTSQKSGASGPIGSKNSTSNATPLTTGTTGNKAGPLPQSTNATPPVTGGGDVVTQTQNFASGNSAAVAALTGSPTLSVPQIQGGIAAVTGMLGSDLAKALPSAAMASLAGCSAAGPADLLGKMNVAGLSPALSAGVQALSTGQFGDASAAFTKAGNIVSAAGGSADPNILSMCKSAGTQIKGIAPSVNVITL